MRLWREGVTPEAFGSHFEEAKTRPRSFFIEFLAPSPRRIVWGAFRGSTMLGFIRLQREGRGVRRHIYSMYVTPAERGRGLARRLLRLAIRQARRAPQVRQVCLKVTATNVPARALYRSIGFRDYGLDHDTFTADGVWHSTYRMRKFVRSRAR